jgi:hypothetical protein
MTSTQLTNKITSANGVAASLEPLPNHNISAFFKARGIEPAKFSEIAAIPAEKLERLLDPHSNPLISEIIHLHQAINRITYCPLDDLINPKVEIRPSQSDKSSLIYLWGVADTLLELDSDKVENGANKSPRIEGLAKKLVEQIENMLEQSMVKYPAINSTVVRPSEFEMMGFENKHCIVEVMKHSGASDYVSLLNKVRKLPIRPTGPEDQKVELARKVLNPRYDFTLNELNTIRKSWFKNNEPIRAADLIISPFEIPKNGFESLTACFTAKFSVLSQVCSALIKAKEMKTESMAPLSARINTLMEEIKPNWRGSVHANIFSRIAPGDELGMRAYNQFPDRMFS